MSAPPIAAGPLRIGLTGGIGAGKSTVAALFAARGAAVIDADRIAREVVEPGEPTLEALAAEFGEQVLSASGGLDRAALAQAAFASKQRTAALNAIIHPAISARTRQRIAELVDHDVVVHDVPLLVENGLSPDYHLCVLVDVPAGVRLERLVASRGLEREDAQRRIAQQADDAARYAACDAVLDNTGDEAGIGVRFAALWERRIAPFAAAVRAGVLAGEAGRRCAGDRRRETESPAESAVDAHAGSRLAARLRRALARTGLCDAHVQMLGDDPVDGVGFRVRLADGAGVPEADLLAAVAWAGWLPAGDDRRLRSADPCRPSTVVLERP